MEKIQIEMSDVLSFHDYGKPEEFEERIHWLQGYHRPMICTEYMARGNGSTFQGSLPIAKKYHVAAINWGLVAGKTQTYLPWDSWKHPYTDREPAVWFHEIFRNDGTPYKPEEVALIRKLIATTYQERMGKYGSRFFPFLDYDGVPSNNNNAEHAIKAFAVLRNVIKGVTSEVGLRDYLVLLSICESCKYKEVDFLDFLRSGEKDIDVFAAHQADRAKVDRDFDGIELVDQRPGDSAAGP